MERVGRLVARGGKHYESSLGTRTLRALKVKHLARRLGVSMGSRGLLSNSLRSV